MSDSSTSKFFGGLLIAVGVLIAGLSGLCSLGLVASSVGSVLQGPGAATNVVMGLVVVGLFGGLPFGLGVLMIVGGWGMMKPTAKPPEVPPPAPDGLQRPEL